MTYEAMIINSGGIGSSRFNYRKKQNKILKYKSNYLKSELWNKKLETVKFRKSLVYYNELNCRLNKSYYQSQDSSNFKY